MLIFSLALMAALQQDLDPTPGRCRFAADRFAPVIPAVRKKLTEDAASPSPQYEDTQRKAILELLASDEVHTATVQKRYASVTPSADDESAVSALGGAELAKLIRRCDP